MQKLRRNINPMLDKLKLKTLAELTDEYGKEVIAAALDRNELAGLQYRYEGQLTGDYDLAEDKSHIKQMVFRDCQEPL